MFILYLRYETSNYAYLFNLCEFNAKQTSHSVEAQNLGEM